MRLYQGPPPYRSIPRTLPDGPDSTPSLPSARHATPRRGRHEQRNSERLAQRAAQGGAAPVNVTHSSRSRVLRERCFPRRQNPETHFDEETAHGQTIWFEHRVLPGLKALLEVDHVELEVVPAQNPGALLETFGSRKMEIIFDSQTSAIMSLLLIN